MTQDVPRRSATGWWLLSGLLALVLIASVVLSVMLARKHHSADQAERDRADATATAQKFAVAMDDVDGAKFADYISGINKLLTTKAKAKNVGSSNPLKEVYEKGKVKGSGKVLATGVTDSDPDSATVLVVHDQEVSSIAGTVKHHYRWVVDVVKVGKKWLVDDFTPTSSEPGDNTGAPSTGSGGGQ